MNSTTSTPPPPENANDECVGPSSATAGQADSCQGCPNQAACASGETAEALAQQATATAQLRACLAPVTHTILVLSGKGGVGKSTVASQLALTLAKDGDNAVGLLDVDLCGPSAPRMVLGDPYTTTHVRTTASGLWIPAYTHDGHLAVMSISFLLPDNEQAVIWRGPRKNALIQQFLSQVDWTGDTEGLDYLIIDTPPGTSDEHISTVQFLQQAGQVTGAIIVTTPEEASCADVRKELNFCKKTGVPILGMIENMGTLETTADQLQFRNTTTGTDCTKEMLDKLRAKCPELFHEDITVHSDVFVGAGAEKMAADYNCSFWGRLPLDTNLLHATDQGKCFVQEHPTATAAVAIQSFCNKLTMACPPEDD